MTWNNVNASSYFKLNISLFCDVPQKSTIADTFKL